MKEFLPPPAHARDLLAPLVRGRGKEVLHVVMPFFMNSARPMSETVGLARAARSLKVHATRRIGLGHNFLEGNARNGYRPLAEGATVVAMSALAAVSADPFAGTVYRDLCIAEDAVALARFHGLEDGIGYDRDEAVASIDDAIVALRVARSRLRGRLNP